jgi:hypothetical protein
MDKEVQEVVHNWLHDQKQTFFLEEILKLVDRWRPSASKRKETM